MSKRPVKLTYHGRERARVEFGFNADQAKQAVTRAIKEGLRCEEASGDVKIYLSERRNPQKGQKSFILDGCVYVIQGKKSPRLITAYPLNDPALAEEAEKQRLAVHPQQPKKRPRREKSVKPAPAQSPTPTNGIKALTIWQPYCQFLVRGIKHFETRTWATKYRGPVAIHAAARPAFKGVIDSLRTLVKKASLPKALRQIVYNDGIVPVESIDLYPRGSVVAIGRLVACHQITPKFLNKVSPIERILGNWHLGDYAWEFEDIIEIPQPIPAKGQQGLWTWKDAPKNTLQAYATRIMELSGNPPQSRYSKIH